MSLHVPLRGGAKRGGMRVSKWECAVFDCALVILPLLSHLKRHNSKKTYKKYAMHYVATWGQYSTVSCNDSFSSQRTKNICECAHMRVYCRTHFFTCKSSQKSSKTTARNVKNTYSGSLGSQGTAIFILRNILQTYPLLSFFFCVFSSHHGAHRCLPHPVLPVPGLRRDPHLFPGDGAGPVHQSGGRHCLEEDLPNVSGWARKKKKKRIVKQGWDLLNRWSSCSCSGKHL